MYRKSAGKSPDIGRRGRAEGGRSGLPDSPEKFFYCVQACTNVYRACTEPAESHRYVPRHTGAMRKAAQRARTAEPGGFIGFFDVFSSFICADFGEGGWTSVVQPPLNF